MSSARISDHALLRFLERAGGIDVELLRDALSAGLARAHVAAGIIGAGNYVIKADGLLFPVRDGVVTTVLDDTGPGATIRAVRNTCRPLPPGRDAK